MTALPGFFVDSAIGAGAFAAVYRATRLTDGIAYAVKAHHIENLEHASRRRAALNEIVLLASLAPHPHIVRFRQALLTERRDHLCLVTELLPGCSLAALLARVGEKRKRVPEHLIWRWFLELAAAVRHLHAARIAHRDIKPANIVADLECRRGLVLVDLGLARRLDTAQGDAAACYSAAGTPMYAAPEVWTHQGAGLPSDMWSLGCVLAEMCTTEPTFTGLSLRQLRAKVLCGAFPTLPAEYSSDMRAVIAALLQVDPAARPTIEQLLAHPAVAPRQAALWRNRPQKMPPVCSNTCEPVSLDRLATCTLAELEELLPPPQYADQGPAAGLRPSDVAAMMASQAGYSSMTHRPDAHLSSWYQSGSAAAAAAAVAVPSADGADPQRLQEEQREAVLRILADASSRGHAAAAQQQAVLRSCSLPNGTVCWSPGGRPIHPKYAAMVAAGLEAEAAGICNPRPTPSSCLASVNASCAGSPTKGPASPLPRSRRPPTAPLSTTGSGVSGAGSTPRCTFGGLNARIEQVQRSGGSAAALAAAVRACLAEQEAEEIRMVIARVSQISSRAATPRGRAPPTAGNTPSHGYAAATQPAAAWAAAAGDEGLRVQGSSPSCPAALMPTVAELAASQPLTEQAVQAAQAAVTPRRQPADESEQAAPAAPLADPKQKKRRWTLAGLLRRCRRPQTA